MLRRLGEELRRVGGVQRARRVSPRSRPRSRALRGQVLQGLPRVRTLQEGRGLHALRARDLPGERGRLLPRRGVPGPRAMPPTVAFFVRAAAREGAGCGRRTKLPSRGRPGLPRSVHRRRGMQAHAGRMFRGERRCLQSLEAVPARRPMFARSRDWNLRRSCYRGLRRGRRVPPRKRAPTSVRAARGGRCLRRPRALVQARRHVSLSR